MTTVASTRISTSIREDFGAQKSTALDRWLLEQGDGLANHKRRAVYPGVLQRQQLADALARYMGQLGLEHRKPPLPSLQQWLDARVARQAEGGTPTATKAGTPC